MPFIINFDSWKVEIKPEQQERADALKQKYHGKVIQNREELIKVQNDLNNELTELTGKGIPKSNYKYGQNVMTQMFGNVNTLIACAVTPEEKNKWEALLNEINDAVANGHAITTEAEEEAALQIDIVSDGFATQHINCYSEGAEKTVDDIIKKVNAAAREGLKNAPIPGEGNDNDAFRRNALEIMLGFSEAALNGSLMEELAKTDDFFAANSIGAVIPSIGQYGVGLKPDSSPYMSDYARFDHLVPLQTPVNKALHLMNGNIDYRKKGSKVSKDDELRIREQILIEGADGLYAVDKIRKNMVNEKVKASFPNEVNGAYTDSIGDRGQFIKWGEIHRARRGLVLNGWAMSDITAIGSLAALFPSAELNRENLAKIWEDYNNALPEYERKLAEYNTKLREYEDKAARGEKVPKPFKPIPKHGKPDSPLYSAEEDEALRQLKEKMDAAVNTAPGNEERRRELINSIIDGIDHLPEQTKKRFPPLTAIREDLKRAAERELTAAEKEILGDQAALKRIADAHPVREYTEAEQQKDLAWLSEIEEKDKELNDIFKTDPYAHDKIREMQALSAANPNLISEGVKKVIGAEAWNAYAARAGRESDELKAIDILTHPDSPHNVSRNHKLLSDVENGFNCLGGIDNAVRTGSKTFSFVQ